MMPAVVPEQAPLPPSAYHPAPARLAPALHIDALALVNALHLLALCRLAVHLAHRRCPPPLPSGPGGAPRTYSEESLLQVRGAPPGPLGKGGGHRRWARCTARRHRA